MGKRAAGKSPQEGDFIAFALTPQLLPSKAVAVSSSSSSSFLVFTPLGEGGDRERSLTLPLPPPPQQRDQGKFAIRRTV